MDSGRDSEFSNVVPIITGGLRSGIENWGSGGVDQPVWATDDEYRIWDREASIDTNPNSNLNARPSQTSSGIEPSNKKSRNAQSGDMQSTNRSKEIGKMFFKTKLCCKFRAGTCPYVTNCNFAHSIEELRRPPPNWQEIVAAHEEDRGGSSEPREEYQIPSLRSSSFTVESERSYKGRHCKKFYTEEGCPYGDSCTFLHDEQSKTRESVAISSGPGGGYGGGGRGGGTTPTGVNAANFTLKPFNWKTRMCNKWQLTGYCPFGAKCRFAHGPAELHRYGGGLMEIDGKDPLTPTDPKQGIIPSKTQGDIIGAGASTGLHSDGYHIEVPSQRLSNVIPTTGQRPHQKWKGPNKISLIYGDWIEDLE